MKVKFIGATRRTGKSKKTGNDYDMCQLTYAIPVQPSARPDNVFSGTGHSVQEIDLCPEAIAIFNNIQLGEEVDLVVQPKPSNPRMTWVVGAE